MVELNGQGREKNRGIAMRRLRNWSIKGQREEWKEVKDHRLGDVGSWKCWQVLHPLATCLDLLEIRKALKNQLEFPLLLLSFRFLPSRLFLILFSAGVHQTFL